jgi:hypothetical protein
VIYKVLPVELLCGRDFYYLSGVLLGFADLVEREGAAEALGIDSDEIKRQAVAKLIIWLSQEDNRLDAAALRDRAAAAFGVPTGVA